MRCVEEPQGHYSAQATLEHALHDEGAPNISVGCPHQPHDADLFLAPVNGEFDDIEDGDKVRRDRESVWVKYGLDNAINIGDFIFSKSVMNLNRLLDKGVSSTQIIKLFKLFTFITDRTIKGQTYDMNARYKEMISIDEYMNIEMLDGEDAGLVYQIPFKNISLIRPKNYDYTLVELKNGMELLLGESQDVTGRNGGVLVLDGEKKERYITWNEVESIHLK